MKVRDLCMAAGIGYWSRLMCRQGRYFELHSKFGYGGGQRVG